VVVSGVGGPSISSAIRRTVPLRRRASERSRGPAPLLTGCGAVKTHASVQSRDKKAKVSRPTRAFGQAGQTGAPQFGKRGLRGLCRGPFAAIDVFQRGDLDQTRATAGVSRPPAGRRRTNAGQHGFNVAPLRNSMNRSGNGRDRWAGERFPSKTSHLCKKSVTTVLIKSTCYILNRFLQASHSRRDNSCDRKNTVR